MNREKVARELADIAKLIVADDDVFSMRVEEMANHKTTLERAIKSKFGYAPKFNVKKSPKSLEFESDMKSDIGIMGLVIKSVTLEVSFYRGNQGSMGDSVWGILSLRWKHHLGGSNGHSVANVWWRNERWIIEA